MPISSAKLADSEGPDTLPVKTEPIISHLNDVGLKFSLHCVTEHCHWAYTQVHFKLKPTLMTKLQCLPPDFELCTDCDGDDLCITQLLALNVSNCAADAAAAAILLPHLDPSA